ncbi:MAG: hypothetical protein HYT71_00335 [Candidatus Aenigmarchaeota archaeon]|nr:hypothetical protein [Candidatus Aenigmarchaeota archaeon]
MKLALFGIILAVIVSGCTGTGDSGNTGTGGSVIIKSFSADETNLQGNDRTTLSTEIINTGDSKATAVKIQLLDLDTACAQPSCDSTETQWGLSSGKTSDVLTDLRINTPGEEAIAKQYNWRVQSPKLPANLPQTYDAKARVSFGYSTTAIKQIKIVTLSEYQRLKTNGQTLPVTTAQPSNGPLKIDVRVAEPVRIEEGSTTFLLVIEVTNLIGGTTFLADNPNDVSKWNLANLKLTLPSGLAMAETSGDCAAITSSVTIELSKGKSYKTQCEVKTTTNIPVSVDKTVNVKADYGYFVESKLSVPISVIGKSNYVPPSGGGAPGQAGTGTVTPPASGGSTAPDTEPPNTVRNIQVQKFAGQPGTASAGKWQYTISFLEPSDNVGVAGFEIYVGTIQPATGTWNTATLDASNEVKKQGLASNIPLGSRTPQGGTVESFPPNGVARLLLDPNTSYWIGILAVDASGNRGDLSTSAGSVIQIQTGSF